MTDRKHWSKSNSMWLDWIILSQIVSLVIKCGLNDEADFFSFISINTDCSLVDFKIRSLSILNYVFYYFLVCTPIYCGLVRLFVFTGFE